MKGSAKVQEKGQTIPPVWVPEEVLAFDFGQRLLLGM